MLTNKTIGFIGAGNMAEALVKGLIRSGKVSPAQIICSDLSGERLVHMAESYEVKVFNKNYEVARLADILLIALKPGEVEAGLRAIAEDLASGSLVISIAAGITTESLQAWCKAEGRAEEAAVIRAMPNTPAIVGEGITGIVAGTHARGRDIDIAAELLGSVGKVVVLEDEAHLDVVTAVSGSGPAYTLLFMEALTDAGVKGGLPFDTAKELALQTTLGAARLAGESSKGLRELRDMVTSPGGTTIEGLNVLKEGRFYDNIIEAVRAAAKRARELSGRSG